MTSNQGNPKVAPPQLAVWYGGEMIAVKILDRFESGGHKLASIKALEGEPFADGAKCTVRTAHLTVRLADVYEISNLENGEEL